MGPPYVFFLGVPSYPSRLIYFFYREGREGREERQELFKKAQNFYCALRTAHCVLKCPAHCVLCSVLRTLVPFFILDDMFVSGE
jgi:hypothetical protein